MLRASQIPARLFIWLIQGTCMQELLCLIFLEQLTNMFEYSLVTLPEQLLIIIIILMILKAI